MAIELFDLRFRGKNFISFTDFKFYEKRMEFRCRIKKDEYRADELIWVDYPEQLSCEKDTDIVAVALSSFAGEGKVDYIEFALKISSDIKDRIEKYTKAKVLCKKKTARGEIVINGDRTILNFSGGFDSLAARALMKQDDIDLVSVDWGNGFERERAFFCTFNPYIVKTNARNCLKFERWSWTFMGIGAMLLCGQLGASNMVFGTVLEASRWNIINAKSVSEKKQTQPFSLVGLKSVRIIEGMTEVGTTLLTLRNYDAEEVKRSLCSLGAIGSEKRARKEILTNIISSKYGIPISVDISPVNKKIKFGDYFATDFLALWILKNSDIDIVHKTIEKIPVEVIDFVNEHRLLFYERIYGSFCDAKTMGHEQQELYIDLLERACVYPYDDIDYKELSEVVNFLDNYHC